MGGNEQNGSYGVFERDYGLEICLAHEVSSGSDLMDLSAMFSSC